MQYIGTSLSNIFVQISLLLSLLLGHVSLSFAATVQTNSPSLVERKEVAAFIDEMARKHNFQKPELISLFKQVKIQTGILEAMARPYEAKPWFMYRERFLTPERIREGIAFWKKHEQTLAQAEAEYGVPANIIVAIIGVETFYGKKQGEHRVIDALSTLAFAYPPRSAYFKRELVQFLLLTREQEIQPTSIKGSYAGAMGQPQFMPSSYRYYAVNFSNEQSQKIDLRHNPKDAIGSVANFFKKHGWQINQPIAMPATSHSTLFGSTSKLLASHKKPVISLQQLPQYGFKHNVSLPPETPVGIVRLEAKQKPEYWVGFKNFYVIKRYNTSELYAMAVHQLSEQLKYQRQTT